MERETVLASVCWAIKNRNNGKSGSKTFTHKGSSYTMSIENFSAQRIVLRLNSSEEVEINISGNNFSVRTTTLGNFTGSFANDIVNSVSGAGMNLSNLSFSNDDNFYLNSQLAKVQ